MHRRFGRDDLAYFRGRNAQLRAYFRSEQLRFELFAQLVVGLGLQTLPRVVGWSENRLHCLSF